MPHAVDFGTAHVVKHFGEREGPAREREVRALTLLDRYAPGLAPRPLPGAPPALRMSRLPGVPLRGTGLDASRTAALAAAVSAVFDAVPPHELALVPPRETAAAHVVARLRAWSANGPGGGDPLVARTAAEGMAWLAGAAHLAPAGLPPVLGPGDGNLANYLWDGERVRVVDFEDSGRSDRGYELAEITEHISAWSPADAGALAVPGAPAPARGDGGPLDAAAFLAHFDLTPAETARLADCRRLLALVWLFLLSYDDPAAPRNPPGTARRQAERVRQRLSA